MPKPVVLRAQEVLRDLEKLHGEKEAAVVGESARPAAQLSFIQWQDPEVDAFQEELKEVDPNAMTPMEALLLVQRWKERFGKG